jgi:hypothetical protein
VAAESQDAGHNVNYTVNDNCGMPACVLSVTSNEPINGTGDGDTAPDWEIVDAHHVRLRAERAGTGQWTHLHDLHCLHGCVWQFDDESGRCGRCAQHHRSSERVFVQDQHGGQLRRDVLGYSRQQAHRLVDIRWLSASGTVTEPSGLKNGIVKGSYKFTAPGVYKVTMFVKDQTGVTSWVDTSGDTESIVVIYDPSGGYTIGGGWITSPPGAFTPDPTLTGKLTFGFNSQYVKNATNPKGEVLVNFINGETEFNALNFDYLTISGARAQFKGFGKINGAAGYDFILTVIDGDLSGGGGVDKFRLKIWEKVTGLVIYDNEPGRSEAADPITPVGDANSTVIIKK